MNVLDQERVPADATEFVSAAGIYPATITKLNVVAGRTNPAVQVLQLWATTFDGKAICDRLSLSVDSGWKVDQIAVATGLIEANAKTPYKMSGLVGRQCYIAVQSRPPAGIRVQRYLKDMPTVTATADADDEASV